MDIKDAVAYVVLNLGEKCNGLDKVEINELIEKLGENKDDKK